MYIISISEDILSLVSGLGLLQGILLAILIYFHPKSERTVGKFLAFYIFCLTIIMAGPLLLKIMRWEDSFFVTPFPTLAGPLLYFYVRSFKETITWRKAWPHLVLFIIYLFAGYFWFSELGKKYPDAKEFPEEGMRSSFSVIFFGVRYVQLVTYYFLSRQELIKYQRSIQQLYSETSRISLNWVKWLVNGYILIILASIVIYLLMTKFTENFYLFYLINIAISTPYIYMATYKGITQPTIWQSKPEDNKVLENQLLETEEILQHKQKKDLHNDKTEEIAIKVLQLMEKERIYQEPELTLQNLADKIEFPSHQVSFAINEGMKKSFYDLINGYRVEEAKKLLLDPKNRNYTILSVGFEAGFNSKTTFHTVFKKFTGLTPTEYREKYKATATVA